MTTKEIAKGLVERCRQGKNNEAISAFYDPNIITYEADPSMPPSNGLAAVEAGAAWREENMVVHDRTLTGPYLNGDQFAVGFVYDVTHKPSGKRSILDEMALYRVSDGKVVEARFFYNTSMTCAEGTGNE